MKHVKKIFQLVDNYVIARWQNRPSTALFWYLPEPPNLKTTEDLARYQKSSVIAPLYLIDYRQKLHYSLENEDGIIVLPYDNPIGQQVNPEAAFQYALGLHDQFCVSNDTAFLDKFFKYASYFANRQTPDGLWSYNFDWFTSKAPWTSALSQSRGASVMLRAWLHSKDTAYLEIAKKALAKFLIPTSEDGFLHSFSEENCFYFEEYPKIQTGVINGFMASLLSIWELHYWIKEPWLANLWQMGITSLEKMLPYYSTGWWSLYDRDPQTPIKNVNSPRYHLLEMNYLQVLSLLSNSHLLINEHSKRVKQYKNFLFRSTALSLKLVRKILYK
jgi:hypothetical protein